MAGVLPAQIPGAVRAQILRIKERISAYPSVCKIYLFGSFAVGTYGVDSDIDIAVFLEDDSPCGLQEYLDLNRLIGESEYDVQLQMFQAEELRDPCGIVGEVVEHGVVLWEKPGL